MIRAVPKPVKKQKPKGKRKSKKSDRTLLIEKIDEYDSDIALIRSNFTCMLCGKRADQNHHFFPKGSHGNVRFNPDNHCPLDFACHRRRVHDAGEVEELRDKLVKSIGEERFLALKELAYKTADYTMPILRDILQKKKTQLVVLCNKHPEYMWGMSKAAMGRLKTARNMTDETQKDR